MRQNFYILDGTSLIYRAFYAIRELRNSKGFPTNAVFGFTKMLQKFLREKKPEYLVAVFDAKGPTFRHKVYEEYKIHRKPMPDELVLQLPWIRDLVRAYQIPILEISGFEADDIIASLTQLAKEDFDVLILSPDKDMLQLVEPHVHVMPHPVEDVLLDEKKIETDFGVPPRKIVDYLALVGDSSDNIPGVSGIGPKSASLLLRDFETLETLFEAPWVQIGRIKKENILQHEAVAKLSKHLARLRLDVPIESTLLTTKLRDFDTQQLAKIFQELEFRDLLREVVSNTSERYEAKVIQTAEDFQKLKEEIHKTRTIGLSLNVGDAHPLSSALLGIAFAIPHRTPYYISLEKGKEIAPFVREILEDSSMIKSAYDIKKIKLILGTHNLRLQEPTLDVMIAGFLTNPARHFRNLEDMGMTFLNQGIQGQTPEERAPQESAIALELAPVLRKLLNESDQEKLYNEIEHPLIEVLAEMERVGLPLDIQQLRLSSQEFQKILNGLESTIHELAGERFNINSPRELSRILFEKLKLPTGKKTKTGFSTNADILQNLIHQHEIIPHILRYREISKLKSTYVDSLPQLVLPQTGRVHTTFSQTTAETGRLSSSNPNLQNIPIRSPLSQKIRAAFIAPDSNTLLLSADYSQIELRILAHLSQDSGLLEAFEKDEDIHRWTAQAVFNVKGTDVTEEQRSRAKAINFGLVYGMGAFGLSKELGISIEEAQTFMDQYHKRFPSVQTFLHQLLEKARKTGFVTTLFHRRRYLPELESSIPQIRQMAERMALNTPIQGTAADLIKIAMIQIHKDLKEQGLQTRLVLQIHDELIFHVPVQELEEAETLVRDRMENVAPLKVRLKVNIHTGRTWLDL